MAKAGAGMRARLWDLSFLGEEPLTDQEQQSIRNLMVRITIDTFRRRTGILLPTDGLLACQTEKEMLQLMKEAIDAKRRTEGMVRNRKEPLEDMLRRVVSRHSDHDSSVITLDSRLHTDLGVGRDGDCHGIATMANDNLPPGVQRLTDQDVEKFVAKNRKYGDLLTFVQEKAAARE